MNKNFGLFRSCNAYIVDEITGKVKKEMPGYEGWFYTRSNGVFPSDTLITKIDKIKAEKIKAALILYREIEDKMKNKLMTDRDRVIKDLIKS